MRILYIVFIFFITACSSNKETKNHGFISLDNKMKKELTKGKKIKVDNIGKFILF